MKNILCIGMANVDVIAAPIDKLSTDGDTTHAEQIRMTTGGDALNTAIRLRNMGCPTAFAGMVGDDAAADFLTENLRGIECSGVIRSKELQTAICMALVDSAGQRKFIYNSGANRLISGKNLSEEMLKDAGIVHVGGIMQLPALEADLHEIFRRAHRHRAMTSMDVTCSTDGTWLSKIDTALYETDYFLPSIDEARAISGYSTLDRICGFFEKYSLKALVIKLGARGCYVTDFKREACLPACVTDVVDTTGAGDTFVAGFLAGVLRGENCFTAAAIGNVSASVCVGAIGASGGNITYESALDLAKKGVIQTEERKI
ncbi:MAG: sugar kinase [Clostridia bacterium]|nr:sugar kinase [Clostridia bacterium]